MNPLTRRQGAPHGAVHGDFAAVNAASLQQGIAMLVEARRELADTLNRLCAEFDPCRDTWDVQTRATYDRVRQEWAHSDQRMAETITRMMHLYQSLPNPNTLRHH